MMLKLVIEVNDLKALMVNKATRNAALTICENMKLSKYSYRGNEAKTGLYYFCDFSLKMMKRLRELIFENEELLSELDISFIIQIIKKIIRNEEGDNNVLE